MKSETHSAPLGLAAAGQDPQDPERNEQKAKIIRTRTRPVERRKAAALAKAAMTQAQVQAQRRRELIGLLKGEERIDCLNLGGYLVMAQLRLQLLMDGYEGRLAELTQAWHQTGCESYVVQVRKVGEA